VDSQPTMTGQVETLRPMTRERLAAFNDAWARADVPALMEFMTEDCVYQASVGPEPGQTFAGKEAVRRGFEALLAHDSEAEGRGGRCFVAGNLGVAEWSYVYMRDGRAIEVRGCDIFEFVGDKIRRKDAFRKTFG
jgi:ketosteroid isomerase-like protein